MNLGVFKYFFRANPHHVGYVFQDLSTAQIDEARVKFHYYDTVSTLCTHGCTLGVHFTSRGGLGRGLELTSRGGLGGHEAHIQGWIRLGHRAKIQGWIRGP